MDKHHNHLKALAIDFSNGKLNALAKKGGLSFSSDAFLAVESHTPGTLHAIAAAACSGHSAALEALVHHGALEVCTETLWAIEQQAFGTIKVLATSLQGKAFSRETPDHLHSYFGLGVLEVAEIENETPGTLSTLYHRAYGFGLEHLKIGANLEIEDFSFLELEKLSPGVIKRLAADLCSNPASEKCGLFIAVAKELNSATLKAIEKNAPGTLLALFQTSEKSGFNIRELPFNQLVASPSDVTSLIQKLVSEQSALSPSLLPYPENPEKERHTDNLEALVGSIRSRRGAYGIDALLFRAVNVYSETDNPVMLDALAAHGGFNIANTKLLCLLGSNPRALHTIAIAAECGHPAALNKLAQSGALSFKDRVFLTLHNFSCGTLFSLATAAKLGHTDALLCVSPTLKSWQLEDIINIEEYSGGTIEALIMGSLACSSNDVFGLAPMLCSMNREQFINSNAFGILPFLSSSNNAGLEGLQRFFPLSENEFESIISASSARFVYNIGEHLDALISQNIVEPPDLSSLSPKVRQIFGLALSAKGYSSWEEVNISSKYPFYVDPKTLLSPDNIQHVAILLKFMIVEGHHMAKEAIKHLGTTFLNWQLPLVLQGVFSIAHGKPKHIKILAPLISYIAKNEVLFDPAALPFRVRLSVYMLNQYRLILDTLSSLQNQSGQKKHFALPVEILEHIASFACVPRVFESVENPKPFITCSDGYWRSTASQNAIL